MDIPKHTMSYTVHYKHDLFPNKTKYDIFKDDQFVCCAILCEYDEFPIVYDAVYDSELATKNWYIMSNGYASIKETYMHHLVYFKSNIKEVNKSIDYINNYKLDNRIANLRMVSQGEQNSNRATRCDKKSPCQELQIAGITELPRHVRWDNSEQKFIIEKHPVLLEEVKNGLRKRACMSGSKSSTLTITQKYQDVLARLRDLDNKHDPRVQEFKELKNRLSDEYLAITKTIYEFEGNDFNVEKNDIIMPVRRTEVGKKTPSNLPDDCGVKHKDIPKYCYYTPKSEKRGDKFTIDRHPVLLQQGLKYWSTTENIKISTKEKFDVMLKKFKELQDSLTSI